MAVTVLALLLMANHIDADIFQHPESDLLDPIIALMATCESGQIPDLKVWDVYSYSYGWLMFKQNTFDYYGEKYGLEHSDIMSPEQQIPIAKRMLKDRLWKKWYNCVKKFKLEESFNNL